MDAAMSHWSIFIFYTQIFIRIVYITPSITHMRIYGTCKMSAWCVFVLSAFGYEIDVKWKMSYLITKCAILTISLIRFNERMWYVNIVVDKSWCIHWALTFNVSILVDRFISLGEMKKKKLRKEQAKTIKFYWAMKNRAKALPIITSCNFGCFMSGTKRWFAGEKCI